MRNAANRKDINEAEKAARLIVQRRREVVIGLMSNEAGREYAFSKLAPVFSTPFHTDPTVLAFNVGVQNAAIGFLNEIVEACPDLFIQAMREANGRRTEHDTRDELRNPSGSVDGPVIEPGPDSDPAAGERPSESDGGRNDQGPVDRPIIGWNATE